MISNWEMVGNSGVVDNIVGKYGLDISFQSSAAWIQKVLLGGCMD